MWVYGNGCGNNGMNEIHHVSWVSCFLFLSKSLLLFCFLVLFLTVAANCHLWAYFIWACFAFVLRSPSHNLSLSFYGARLHLPKSGWAKRGSSCDCDFRLMQFIIMATAAETAAAAAEAEAATAAATSAAIAIELPFGNECRPNAAADTGATWVTQKRLKRKREKNKAKLKKRPRNKSENLFCYCLDVCTACK